jgi:hypothetical protein
VSVDRRHYFYRGAGTKIGPPPPTEISLDRDASAPGASVPTRTCRLRRLASANAGPPSTMRGHESRPKGSVSARAAHSVAREPTVHRGTRPTASSSLPLWSVAVRRWLTPFSARPSTPMRALFQPQAAQVKNLLHRGPAYGNDVPASHGPDMPGVARVAAAPRRGAVIAGSQIGRRFHDGLARESVHEWQMRPRLLLRKCRREFGRRTDDCVSSGARALLIGTRALASGRKRARGARRRVLRFPWMSAGPALCFWRT